MQIPLIKMKQQVIFKNVLQYLKISFCEWKKKSEFEQKLNFITPINNEWWLLVKSRTFFNGLFEVKHHKRV